MNFDAIRTNIKGKVNEMKAEAATIQNLPPGKLMADAKDLTYKVSIVTGTAAAASLAATAITSGMGAVAVLAAITNEALHKASDKFFTTQSHNETIFAANEIKLIIDGYLKYEGQERTIEMVPAWERKLLHDRACAVFNMQRAMGAYKVPEAEAEVATES